MKKRLSKFILNFLILSALNFPAQENQLPLVPLPNSIKITEGFFVLTPQTKLVSSDAGLVNDLLLFNSRIKQLFGYTLSIESTDPVSGNFVFLNASNLTGITNESYEISCTEKSMIITAAKNGSGFMYGLQTLIQLMVGQNTTNNKEFIKIPCVKISDEPRFKWRGMHLDVCRHFFSKDFVKKYIDVLSLYKFNTFHWHLTEDQGWRVEIKKYPRLSQFGAWRNGTMIGKYSDQKFDTIKYGGFYTQEEIKEVVAYATERHITIVPEIEMPGHSVAAISAYPYLSCNGKQIDVAKAWGVFNEVYCTKDSTFEFLQNVLTEVMELFPGKYIHIGGDECPKESWKKCKNCQALIQKEGLKDEHELQSYFISRIEKFVNSKGKQIIGWDEILEGGLAPNAAVMSWRGTQGGIAAAKQKHFVVMSPGKPCYFDHYQSEDRTKEPLAIGGYNPLDSVYAYDPLPKELNAVEKDYVMGAQANVWTEYILNEKQVEYMALPRLSALAEVLWTKPENKNYPNFITRLKQNSKLLDAMNVNYAKHFLIKK